MRHPQLVFGADDLVEPGLNAPVVETGDSFQLEFGSPDPRHDHTRSDRHRIAPGFQTFKVSANPRLDTTDVERRGNPRPGHRKQIARGAANQVVEIGQ